MVLNDGYSDVVLDTMSVTVPLASLIYDGARIVVTYAVGMVAKLIGLRMRRPRFLDYQHGVARSKDWRLTETRYAGV